MREKDTREKHLLQEKNLVEDGLRQEKNVLQQRLCDIEKQRKQAISIRHLVFNTQFLSIIMCWFICALAYF
jgi:RNase adaptor protein for sRNA GlmZ degradation